MKIVDNSKKSAPTTFYDILPGTVFSMNGNVVVKATGGRVVRLFDGLICDLPLDWIVETIYHDAVLYLHGAPNE